MTLIFSLILGWPAAADLCPNDAGAVSRAVAQIHLRPVSFAENELLLRMEGRPDCAPGLEVDVLIDEAAAHELASGVGSVLSARAHLDGDLVRVALSGQSRALSQLADEWARSRDLRHYFREVAFRWYARYQARAVVKRAGALRAIANDCRPGLVARMECDAFRDWSFITRPECVRSESTMDLLRSSVEFEDPFLAGTDPRVSVRGVARTLCGRVRWPETSFLDVVASDLIFGERRAYGRRDVSGPAVIEVKGEISW